MSSMSRPRNHLVSLALFCGYTLRLVFLAAVGLLIPPHFANADAAAPRTTLIPLHFHRGWNCFSVPAEPIALTIADLFHDENSGPVWTFTDGRYTPADRLEAGKGYMVYLRTPATVVIRGHENRAPAPRITNPGWNFIGAFAASAMPAVDGTVAWYFADGQFYPHADELVPGQAYWVNLESGETLDLAAASTDSDRDGAPDYWEYLWGFNPRQTDALANPDDDFVPNLAEYKDGTNPLLADTDDDGAPDWVDRDIRWHAHRAAPPLPNGDTNQADADFDQAFRFLDAWSPAPTVSSNHVEEARRLQERLRTAVLSLPDHQRPAYVGRFNEFIGRVDSLVAAKPLAVMVSGGRTLVVANHTELMTTLVRRYSLMDPSGGEVDFTRFAGITVADVDDLDTLADYVAARTIGPAYDMPIFEMVSPLGHVQLLARLVRKFADSDISTPIGPADVVHAEFMRWVDGTKPAFDSALAKAKLTFAANPVLPVSSPLTIAQIKSVMGSFDRLQRALTNEMRAEIEAFDGEAVFKDSLLAELETAINFGGQGLRGYTSLWRDFVVALDSTPVRYVIADATVVLSPVQLTQFVAGLPYDAQTLFRYPGIQAAIDSTQLSGLIAREFYDRLAYIKLRQPATSVAMDVDAARFANTDPIYFSDPARRFQILELLLTVWRDDVIAADGSVRFDRLRSRLLLNDELEAQLAAAEAFIAEQRAALLAIAGHGVISSADFDSMKTLLRQTKAHLQEQFEPLLAHVIYDTRNELTVRIDSRYRELVAQYTAVVDHARLTVTMANGTRIDVDPRALYEAAIRPLLDAITVNLDNRGFRREQYLRLTGITQTMMDDLLSIEEIAELKRFEFEEQGHGFFWHGDIPAGDELLFRLVPRMVATFGTGNPATLAAALSAGLELPVPVGTRLLDRIDGIVAEVSSPLLHSIRTAAIVTVDDLLRLKDAFVDYRRVLTERISGLTISLRGAEIAWLESRINWSWGQGATYSSVRSAYDQRLNEVAELKVDGVSVPLKTILGIERFPWSEEYDRELFTGILTVDVDTAETWSEANAYRMFTLSTRPTDHGGALSALGRIQVVAHVVQRLHRQTQVSAEVDAGQRPIFFPQHGGTAVDPEGFRLYVKGVPAMIQGIVDAAGATVDAAAARMRTLSQSQFTATEVSSLYQTLVLGTRAALIAEMETAARKHESQDVMRAENAVTRIYQDRLFDPFVAMVRQAELVVAIDNRSVLVPAQAITQELLSRLRQRFGGAVAAHHFATFWGIRLGDVRSLHKLENYLGEQIVVLPRNSAFVQIVSQISELGFMQLASSLVERFAADVIDGNGDVDVQELVRLVGDRDRAVNGVLAAIDTRYQQAAQALDAVPMPLTMDRLTAIATTIEDAKIDVTSLVNDFLSGVPGEQTKALKDQLETYINDQLLQRKARRDAVISQHPFVYLVVVGGQEQTVTFSLDDATVGRFIRFAAQYAADHPEPPDNTDWVGDLWGPAIAVDAPAARLLFDGATDALSIWLPIPAPEYDPSHHPTTFGMTVLFTRLVRKYGEFVVVADETGQLMLDMDRFEEELLRPDSDRAERRLTAILDSDLPQVVAFADSLRDADGAMPVSAIDEITARFVALKARIVPLSGVAYTRAIEVWGECIDAYENMLFFGSLSTQVDNRRVTFEPAVLDATLMDVYHASGIRADLIDHFADRIDNGETTWAYEEFKSLGYIYLRDAFHTDKAHGFIAAVLPDIPRNSEEDNTALRTLTLGALAGLLGIHAQDLAGLDVVEKDILRVVVTEPAKLLGFLDMRALAPGSGVDIGGLTQKASANSAAISSDVVAAGEVGGIMPGSAAEIDLEYKSKRFRVLDLIPNLIAELGAEIWDDLGRVSADAFRQAIQATSTVGAR